MKNKNQSVEYLQSCALDIFIWSQPLTARKTASTRITGALSEKIDGWY